MKNFFVLLIFIMVNQIICNFCFIGLILFTGKTNAIEPTNVKTFPYHISLGTLNQHHCSGAIISNRHILTSARCVSQLPYKSRFGYEGIYANIGTGNILKKGEIHEIVKIVAHPGFWEVGPNNYRHDIAIVTLRRSIKFNKQCQPVGLPTYKIRPNTAGIVTGWGNNPTELQKASMKIISNMECQNRINLWIPPEQICAISVNGYARQADDGSPLVVDGIIVGIASCAANSRCVHGSPDVYTNVISYKKYILSNMLHPPLEPEDDPTTTTVYNDTNQYTTPAFESDKTSSSVEPDTNSNSTSKPFTTKIPSKSTNEHLIPKVKTTTKSVIQSTKVFNEENSITLAEPNKHIISTPKPESFNQSTNGHFEPEVVITTEPMIYTTEISNEGNDGPSTTTDFNKDINKTTKSKATEVPSKFTNQDLESEVETTTKFIIDSTEDLNIDNGGSSSNSEPNKHMDPTPKPDTANTSNQSENEKQQQNSTTVSYTDFDENIGVNEDLNDSALEECEE